ncbi:MAG: Lrp/AsnC family transcriptional regulator [Rhodobacterales bacterium]|nr:Lrp/AsnC family transcriptional regulator [Pseudomonadota bacterium]MDA1287396.1 Lrp/AsnC family transcriptional regulator [Pseudomonadota bacterium]NQW13981.1 Lrp/AsnC family transcriptional regulator [Rhodobacter sp.]HBN30566.1 AsnC family transcriptional regulator [Paracoccaceae bacterium]
MDDLDQQLLNVLSKDARLTVSTIARQLGIARTTVQARIDRLEDKKVIAGYTIRMGEKFQLDRIKTTVLLHITPQATVPLIGRLRRYPQVIEAHTTSGRFDLIILLACQNTVELDDLLDEICALDGVISSESLVHLATRIDRGI